MACQGVRMVLLSLIACRIQQNPKTNKCIVFGESHDLKKLKNNKMQVLLVMACQSVRLVLLSLIACRIPKKTQNR